MGSGRRSRSARFSSFSFLRMVYLFICSLKIVFIYVYRGGEGGRKGEKPPCVRDAWIVASHTLLVGDLACNPDMCTTWESNQ